MSVLSIAATAATAVALACLGAGCVHRPSADTAGDIGCRGATVLVVENGTPQNLEVVWFGGTIGVANARATSRIPAPSGFPCRQGDCRGPEFRNQDGTLPAPGPFRQSFGYYIECH